MPAGLLGQMQERQGLLFRVAFFLFFFGLQSTELSQPPYCRTGELGGKWERTGGGNGTEQECRGGFFFFGGCGGWLKRCERGMRTDREQVLQLASKTIP